VADWETVRELAFAFPEVEEDMSGRLMFRVRGKPFAWLSRERDGGGLAVRVDRDEKQLLLESNPAVYYCSPHYERYPGVQIRLQNIERDELAERIEDAWSIQAPKRLVAEFFAEQP
jgi:hypothetical protein